MVLEIAPTKAWISKQMRSAQASCKESCPNLYWSHSTLQYYFFELTKDTPVGLPPEISKLGSFSSHNPTRDFQRSIGLPLDRVLLRKRCDVSNSRF